MIQPLNLNEFKDRLNQGDTVVDTRSSETFAEGFIPQSLSIPFNENFIHWVEELIEDEQKIVLIADENELPAIADIFRSTGLDNVNGFLKGGFQSWQDAGNEMDMLITIEADEFAIDYQFDEFYLVDVRNKEDFEKERAEDAENIVLGDLEYIISEFDEALSYYIYGETAGDAITAGSIFRKLGFERVRVVATDYAGIKNSKIPFFTNKKKTSSQNL